MPMVYEEILIFFRDEVRGLQRVTCNVKQVLYGADEGSIFILEEFFAPT